MSLKLRFGKTGTYKYNNTACTVAGTVILDNDDSSGAPVILLSENLDYLKTGKRSMFGMHGCDHRKVTGLVDCLEDTGTSFSTGVFPFNPAELSYVPLEWTVHPTCQVRIKRKWYNRAGLFPGDCGYVLNDSSAYGRKYDLLMAAVERIIDPLTGVPMCIGLDVRVSVFNDETQNVTASVTFALPTPSYTSVSVSIPISEQVSITSRYIRSLKSYAQMKAYALYWLTNRTTYLNLVAPSVYSASLTVDAPKITKRFRTLYRAKLIALLDYERIPSPSARDWGDLCQQAINDCRMVDINTCVWFKEILELKRTLKSTYDLLTGDVSPKSLSKLFLSDKFGAKLTISDSVELAEQVKRALNSVPLEKKPYNTGRTRRIETDGLVVRQLNYTIYYSEPSNALLRVLKKGLDWDILPTLQNAWDMVPFSFVVDYFVDVEGFCQTIDTAIYEQYLDVYLVCFTDKVIKPIRLPLPFHGSVILTEYHRHLARTLHAYYPDLDRSDRWKDSIGIMTALILVQH